MYEQLVRGIAESRKKTVEDVRALIDEGPFLAARRATARAWSTRWRTKISSTITAPSARAARSKGRSYGRPRRSLPPRNAPRVAVVYITGIINSGDSGFDPLNGDVAGSTRLVKAIRAARADDSVRAIVVRIDSPGGSSIASDVIWRELTVTSDEKPARPLVASMSDLAASGGYYVAVAAPHDRGAAGHADRLDRHLRRQVHHRRHLRQARRQHRGGHHRAQRRAWSRRIGRSPTASAQKLREQMRDFYDGFVAEGGRVAQDAGRARGAAGAGARVDRRAGAAARPRRCARRPRSRDRARERTRRASRPTPRSKS